MTVIPADCMSIRWVFDLLESNSPVEIAVIGVHAKRVHHAGNNVSWQSDIDALASEMRASWLNHSDTSLFSTCLKLNRAEVYHLGTDGKTLDKGTAPAVDPDTWRGSVGTSLPWECALAVTLYGWDPTTFNSAARSQRGRFYLPALPVNVMAPGTPKVDYDKMTSFTTVMAAFLNDVQGKKIGQYDIPQDSIDIGVLSRTKGTFTPITNMSIDNKVDSQRRRQNKLGGTKNFATISGS